MKIYALRGYSGNYPEDTLLAFQKAMEYGSDGIFLDVHFSRDHKLIVLHEDALSRTVDAIGYVRHHTSQDLKNYEFKDYQGKEPLHLITLEEYFQWKKDLPFTTFIHMKNDRFFYPGMEMSVAAMVQKYGEEERCVIVCKRVSSLKLLRLEFPKIRIGWLIPEHTQAVFDTLEEIKPDMILPVYAVTDDELVRYCNEQKIMVIPYHVDSNQQMQRMAGLKVHGILTMFVERARETMGITAKTLTPEQLETVLPQVNEEKSKMIPRTTIPIPKQSKLLSDGLLGVLIGMIISVGGSVLITMIITNVLRRFF